MKRLPSLSDYMVAACEFCGVTHSDIASPSRTDQVVRARALFCAAAHRSGRYSYLEIARFVGRNNHSTAGTATRRTERDSKLKRDTGKVFRAAQQLAASAAEVG